MCLILFALDAHPDYRLLLAANRDESFARPSAAAAFWDDAPHVLAGRDLDRGGSWLGVTRSGRFAAVTNYRGATPVDGGESRGALVAQFLRGTLPAPEFIAAVAGTAARFQGFSLLAGDPAGLYYYSNRDPHGVRASALEPGVHGLSNHLLDTPWPKVERGKAALSRALPLAPEAREQALLALLTDRAAPPADALPDDALPDDALPSQGAPLAFERALAAPFIHAPERDYGTRCTTLLAIGRDGTVDLVEHTWRRDTALAGSVRHAFKLA
jgi:uncharacterized protein with NRDE domain